MSSITRKMADFAINLRYEDIPKVSIKEAKRFLLDSVGCALAAVPNSDMAAMYRFIDKLGGIPEASLIGTGTKTNASNAVRGRHRLPIRSRASTAASRSPSVAA